MSHQFLIATTAILLSQIAIAADTILFTVDPDASAVIALKPRNQGPDTQWIDAEKFTPAQQKLVEKGVTARGFDLVGKETTYRFSGWQHEAPCEWNRYVNIEPKPQPAALDGTAPVYAISANWKLMPRAVKKLSNLDPTYIKIVNTELQRLGIQQKAKIEQILQTDLDGDGKNEVLIAAGTSVPSQASVGDYSIVFVRKIVKAKQGGKETGGESVQTFYLTSYQVETPYNEDTGEGAMQGERNWISAVADIDGDGKMEVFVDFQAHESFGVNVSRWNGVEFNRVVEWGCGV
jgi:hypothetical protein